MAHRIALLSALLLALCTQAEASDLQRAVSLRRAGQEHVAKARRVEDSAPHWEKAIKAFEQARDLLDTCDTSDPAVASELANVNSLLFWSGRMKPLDLGKGSEPESPAKEKEPQVEQDPAVAERMFDAAVAFAKEHPDEDLLNMTRFFEVAKKFIRTAPGIATRSWPPPRVRCCSRSSGAGRRTTSA